MATAEQAPNSDQRHVAWAPELDRFRDYLLILARMQLAGKSRGRLDASDIVQQALLDAHRNREMFRGRSDAELAGWLRKILACTLGAELRSRNAAKRDAARERSFQADLDASSARLDAWLAADQSSPSERVDRNDRFLRVATVLSQIPDAQRDALILKYCQDCSLDEIGRRLDRTQQAVANLIHRGTKQLRVLLRGEK